MDAKKFLRGIDLFGGNFLCMLKIIPLVEVSCEVRNVLCVLEIIPWVEISCEVRNFLCMLKISM